MVVEEVQIGFGKRVPSFRALVPCRLAWPLLLIGLRNVSIVPWTEGCCVPRTVPLHWFAVLQVAS